MIVRSPQPGDIGKITKRNHLSKKKVNNNPVRQSTRRVDRLHLDDLVQLLDHRTGLELNTLPGLIVSLEVASGFQVNRLHMGVNYLH